MQYLNLELSVLDSVEFVGSEPVDQATWLKLQRYCAGQENGGIIADCREWKDRKCQQLLRITRAEMHRDCDLWTWDGTDLHLFAYPLDAEQTVKQKRAAGRTGGQARTQAKAEAARRNGTQAQPKHNPSEHPTEGKGKEGKEKERKPFATDGASSDPLPPPDSIRWSSSSGFSGITPGDRTAWAEAFPALDIESQIARANEWLIANPAKRKKNVRRFLVAWLSRSQERGGDRSAPPKGTKPELTDAERLRRLGGRIDSDLLGQIGLTGTTPAP